LQVSINVIKKIYPLLHELLKSFMRITRVTEGKKTLFSKNQNLLTQNQKYFTKNWYTLYEMVPTTQPTHPAVPAYYFYCLHIEIYLEHNWKKIILNSCIDFSWRNAHQQMSINDSLDQISVNWIEIKILDLRKTDRHRSNEWMKNLIGLFVFFITFNQ
jgi:hypothetical protein